MRTPTPVRTGPAAVAACPREAIGELGGDAGPSGRLVFVARELAAALRRRQAHRTSSRTGSTTRETR